MSDSLNILRVGMADETLVPATVPSKGRTWARKLWCWFKGHRQIVAGFDYENEAKPIRFCQCQVDEIMAVETYRESRRQ